MRLRMLGMFLGLLLSSSPFLALSEASESELLEVPVKLHSDEGCWHYFGDAAIYAGTFKKGAYIGVSMVTIGPSGFPEPSNEEERTPVLDAPEFKGGQAAQKWFGDRKSVV